jgi:hypothetical protein
MKIEVKESEAVKIPDGVYEAKLKSFSEKDEMQYGPTLSLLFEITTGEEQGTELDLLCSRKLTRGKTLEKSSKLYRVVKALQGSDPEGTVDLNDLTGKACKILVSNDSGSEWSKITQVLQL